MHLEEKYREVLGQEARIGKSRNYVIENHKVVSIRKKRPGK